MVGFLLLFDDIVVVVVDDDILAHFSSRLARSKSKKRDFNSM